MNEISTRAYYPIRVYEFLTKSKSNIENPTQSRNFYLPPQPPNPSHIPNTPPPKHSLFPRIPYATSTFTHNRGQQVWEPKNKLFTVV
jgi:hypothetical protein